jgi:hypothetical protein
MPSQRFPLDAPRDVQEAFREVWEILDRVSGSRNVDWKGRRVINAGDAVQEGDYVTLRQVTAQGSTLINALNASVRRLEVLIRTIIPLTDPSIFTDLGLVLGPLTSVDNAVVRFDGITGTSIQGGAAILGDDGRIGNVTDPGNPQDVATKAYVDARGMSAFSLTYDSVLGAFLVPRP